MFASSLLPFTFSFITYSIHGSSSKIKMDYISTTIDGVAAQKQITMYPQSEALDEQGYPSTAEGS